MGTENSSPDTRKRAKDLANAIGRCVVPSHSLRSDQLSEIGAQLPHRPEHGHTRDGHPRPLCVRDGREAALPRARRDGRGEPRAAEHPGALADGRRVPVRAADAVGAREAGRASRAWKRECG